MQLIEETHVLKVPLSLEPLENVVKFAEDFNVKVTRRLDILAESYHAFLKGSNVGSKTLMIDRHMEVINRTLTVAHDLLRQRHKQFRIKTQKALAYTMNVRQPPNAWYEQSHARIRGSSGEMFSPGRKGREMIENDTHTNLTHHLRRRRGALALMGTMATSMAYSELWPLVADKPLFSSIGDWLEGIFFPQPPDKGIERRVMELFEMQKRAPSLQYSSVVNDPSLVGYLKQFLRGASDELKKKSRTSKLMEVAELAPVVQVEHPTPLRHDSVSTARYAKQEWYDNDYVTKYGEDPHTADMVAEYTEGLDLLHYVCVNMMKIQAEVSETIWMTKILYDDKEKTVQGYSDLLQDLDRGLSILHSKVHMLAWESIAKKIPDDGLIASASEQLGRIKPQLYVNPDRIRRSEFEIHLVIEHIDPALEFQIYRSRTVPFKSDMGTKEIVIPEVAQAVSVDVNSVYRFPWNRLTSCQMHDHTYYCDRTVLEADSSGRCVETITSAHMSDLDVFTRCKMMDAEDTYHLTRLADDLIYYDVGKSVAELFCAVSRAINIKGKGIIRLNPRCSVKVDSYTFRNDRGMTYTDGEEMVLLQREMTFGHMKLPNHTSLGVLPLNFTDWSLGDMMLIAEANDLFFRLASSGNEGVAGLNTLEAKMAMAIAGGVFGGLMAMYVFISAPGIEQGSELIRKGTIYTFLTWFVIDGGASIASGNIPNLIPNTVFLITYLAPVVLVKRAKV